MWLKHIYSTAWAEFYWELYNKALLTIMSAESYGGCTVLLNNSNTQVTTQVLAPITKEVNHNVG